MFRKIMIIAVLLLTGCGNAAATNTQESVSGTPTTPPMTNVTVPWGTPYTTDLFTITMSRPQDVSEKYNHPTYETTVTVTANESLELSAIGEHFIGKDTNFGEVYIAEVGSGILPEGYTRVARHVQIVIVESPYDGRGFSFSCVTQVRNETATWNYTELVPATGKEK